METDKISEADRVERAGLDRAVSDIERQMRDFPIGTRPFFSAALLNARARIGVLEQKIEAAEREQQEHSQNEAAIVTLAVSETKLSASEKETYSGFLKKDFFTKKDFGALDQFYAKTWDRLTEHGKDEMSHRVWEGVRKKEYEFGDLPPTVREKETERAYQVLKQRQPAQGASAEITEHDRTDFIRAYETGDRYGASKILGRDSFKETMFRGKESAALSHETTQISRPADATALISRADKGMAEATEKKTSEAGKGANADASLLGLGGVKLVDTPTQGTSADLPIAKTTSGQQLTRGS